MKNITYSIRISGAMNDFIREQAKKKQLVPSEYLRFLIQREIEKEDERKANKKAAEILKKYKPAIEKLTREEEENG